ncbi:MAG TPA: DEAD/DEAH box helicase, partial [Proteobacteria bacterium]|nr:DEAD/DEAH box helicase [Pseudomonadota bacterium]
MAIFCCLQTIWESAIIPRWDSETAASSLELIVGGEAERLYSRAFGFPPRAFQREAFERISGWLQQGAVPPLLVRAPCGSGKTEAIVAPFLYQWFEGRFYVPRLIWVLPTRALIDQITGRLKGYAEKVDDRIRVAAQHGETQDAPWFFADVVITTLDQLIYGYARLKRFWLSSSDEGDRYRGHIELSCGDLAHSLVVFDEAHMYSPYTWGLVHSLFEILHASRIPFILSTATLPDSLKSGFERGVLSDGFVFEEVEGDFSDIAGRAVLTEYIEEPLTGGGLNERVIKEIDGAKRALVVVNRVEKAQDVYRRLKDRFPDREVLLI